MTYPNEVERLLSNWLDRTVELHHQELQRLGIGESGDLDKSIRGEYRRLAEGYLEGNLYFDEHGRFVDMGSGRGWSHGKRERDSFDQQQRKNHNGRPKKRWYSRVWYARLNDLQGAVGFRLMEQVIQIQQAAFKDI